MTDTLEPIARLAFALLLLGSCSRPTPPTPETKPSPVATVVAEAHFVVRVHRWGGGPASLDHTLEVANDGSVHLHGYDHLWCTRAKEGNRSAVRAVVDIAGALDARTFEEIRALANDPEVARYPSATPPARAPERDGVAAEISLPTHAPILVDGVRGTDGKVDRLLGLAAEVAGRLGVAAACRD